MTRYTVGDGPRRRRAHQWEPDILSEPVERLAAILAEHFATMSAEEAAMRRAAARPIPKAGRPFRGLSVPGLPCTRTKPGGFGRWEEWQTVLGVSGHC